MKRFIADPLTEALAALATEAPPSFTRGHVDTSKMTDDQVESLQSWCVDHCKLVWSTGIGMMEAAELVVREAINNGNIYHPKSCEVCQHYLSASHPPACIATYGRCALTGANEMDHGSCDRFELADELALRVLKGQKP
jgi:hypothetical protein